MMPPVSEKYILRVVLQIFDTRYYAITFHHLLFEFLIEACEMHILAGDFKRMSLKLFHIFLTTFCSFYSILYMHR